MAARRDRLRLELHLGLEALLGGLVEEQLGAAEGQGRPLSELPGQGAHRARELGVGMHAVDQSPVHRLPGREHPVGVVQLERAPEPDQARQEVGRRAVRGGRDLGVGHGELGGLGGHHQVPAQRKAHAAARRDPVHRHHHRLLGAGQPRHRPVQIGGQLLDQDPDAIGVVREVLHVTARAERLAGSGDHDAAHRTILIRLERGVEQLTPKRQVQRVVRLRPVQRDRPHPILHLIPHRLVSHLSLQS